MRELVGRVPVPAKFFLSHPQVPEPLQPFAAPVFEPLVIGARLHEKLHLHLFELAGPEEEVLGVDLVAERFPDLGDAEGDLLPAARLDVEEIHENSLRGFGTEVDHGAGVLDGPHERLEHQVELAGVGECFLVPARGAGEHPEQC